MMRNFPRKGSPAKPLPWAGDQRSLQRGGLPAPIKKARRREESPKTEKDLFPKGFWAKSGAEVELQHHAPEDFSEPSLRGMRTGTCGSNCKSPMPKRTNKQVLSTQQVADINHKKEKKQKDRE